MWLGLGHAPVHEEHKGGDAHVAAHLGRARGGRVSVSVRVRERVRVHPNPNPNPPP